MEGPDHSSSLDPQGFSELVKWIRAVEMSLGSAEKKPTSSEKENMMGMRRSIVAANHLPAGTTITEEYVLYKRPATGLAPNKLHLILGKKLKCDVQRDQQIELTMFDI